MEYIARTLDNLVHQTAFFNLTWGNYLMICVALVFMYLAIAKEFEPLLLVPISFGMLLVNIYPDIMAVPTETASGGLLYYFFQLDEWAILPSLIFMGVGAMTDFGPLIASPSSFLMGAAAQFGIFSAYFGAIALGFNGKAATEKRLQLFPSSEARTARHPSSFAPSWDRQNCWGRSRSRRIPICRWYRSSSPRS